VNSGIEKVSSLRNERKPCHFWVDNEVADCYQAIVGADAIWVYCRIARYANGAWIVSPKLRGTSDARVGLREMAEWCGKSVDTVARSLEVLELVGLLRSERGGARSKGRYALADVKDLVIREGGQYDREIGGYRLPDERVAQLKEQVRAMRLKLARKSQLTIVECEEAELPPRGTTVAQSDRLEVEPADALTAGSDSSVRPERQNCASGATAINLLEEIKTSRETTPPTPSPGGEGDESATAARMRFESPDEVQAAVDQVCEALGIVMLNRSRRTRELLFAVMNQRMKTTGESPPETAALMVRRWQRQVEVSGFLRVKLGLRKFFGEGYWLDENRWFWDEAKWKLHCEAKVGSWG
jgi:hypothetical protein